MCLSRQHMPKKVKKMNDYTQRKLKELYSTQLVLGKCI